MLWSNLASYFGSFCDSSHVCAQGAPNSVCVCVCLCVLGVCVCVLEPTVHEVIQWMSNIPVCTQHILYRLSFPEICAALGFLFYSSHNLILGVAGSLSNILC